MLNNDLSDMLQEKINSVSSTGLGTLGLAMKNIDLNSKQINDKQLNRKERREAKRQMEKEFEKNFGGQSPVSPKEEVKAGKEGSIYRNAKELYIAGAEGEGYPLEKERVKQEEVIETTFEYFKRHPKGTCFWEYDRPNFNKVLFAYYLSFDKIRPVKHREKKNILIIAKPDSKKETLPKWYKGYEDTFYSTRTGYLFVSESESVCGMSHVYSPEKYRKQFLYGDDIKGRVEFIPYQDFEESIDEDGKILAIREEDEDIVWDIVILDNVDISNPAFFKINRRYTLCLLPHVSDFPQTLPVERIGQETLFEAEPAVSASPKPSQILLNSEEEVKPMEWIGGYPGMVIETMGSKVYGKARKDLSQEEVDTLVTSLDNLINQIKEDEAEEEHQRKKPSDTASLQTQLDWNEANLEWIERRIREAEEKLPDKSFELAQIRRDEAKEQINQIEDEIKKEKELKFRAENHDMDHAPETDDITDFLGYWKEDLYLAQNYYQDEERAQMARQNIETLQKAFELMHPKE